MINKVLKVKYQPDENVRIEFLTGTKTEVKKIRDGKTKSTNFEYRDIDPTEAKFKIDLGDEKFLKWTCAKSRTAFEMMMSTTNKAGWIDNFGIGIEAHKLFN